MDMAMTMTMTTTTTTVAMTMVLEDFLEDNGAPIKYNKTTTLTMILSCNSAQLVLSKSMVMLVHPRDSAKGFKRQGFTCAAETPCNVLKNREIDQFTLGTDTGISTVADGSVAWSCFGSNARDCGFRTGSVDTGVAVLPPAERGVFLYTNRSSLALSCLTNGDSGDIAMIDCVLCVGLLFSLDLRVDVYLVL